MGHNAVTPIIVLTGPPGRGKTTLCRLFLDAFASHSVLAVDASSDGYLALSYGEGQVPSMATLLQKVAQTPIHQEAIDWTLQDLPVSVASEGDADVLLWGVLPPILSPDQEQVLTYGLPRLFAHYDVVVWDGPFEQVKALLPQLVLYPVLVIAPQDEPYCQTQPETPLAVLLSKAERTDHLPQTALQRIQAGQWQMMGKLPPLDTPEQRMAQLPQYFMECFQKLDLPFEIRPVNTP